MVDVYSSHVLCKVQHLSDGALTGRAPPGALFAALLDPRGAWVGLLCALRFTGMPRGTTRTGALLPAG